MKRNLNENHISYKLFMIDYLEIQEARRVLKLPEDKFSDDQVIKIIDEFKVLAKIFVSNAFKKARTEGEEDLNKKRVTLHTKILYNSLGDNQGKEVEELSSDKD